jgi:hypothetical protein
MFIIIVVIVVLAGTCLSADGGALRSRGGPGATCGHELPPLGAAKPSSSVAAITNSATASATGVPVAPFTIAVAASC